MSECYDMRPIRKSLNKELRQLAKQHSTSRKRLEWLDKDIQKKLRERNKIESETDDIDSKITHLKGVLKKARK